jgi:hypothetical protein
MAEMRMRGVLHTGGKHLETHRKQRNVTFQKVQGYGEMMCERNGGGRVSDLAKMPGIRQNHQNRGGERDKTEDESGVPNGSTLHQHQKQEHNKGYPINTKRSETRQRNQRMCSENKTPPNNAKGREASKHRGLRAECSPLEAMNRLGLVINKCKVLGVKGAENQAVKMMLETCESLNNQANTREGSHGRGRDDEGRSTNNREMASREGWMVKGNKTQYKTMCAVLGRQFEDATEIEKRQVEGRENQRRATSGEVQRIQKGEGQSTVSTKNER